MAINIKPSHEGRLHKNLGVAKGKPIPAGKLEKATHSKSEATKKQAVFAENAKHWNHGGKKQTTSAGREVERRLNAKDKW
jgi:hypothetical protein